MFATRSFKPTYGQSAKCGAPVECRSLPDIGVGVGVGFFLGLGNKAAGAIICLSAGMRRTQLSRAIVGPTMGRSKRLSRSRVPLFPARLPREPVIGGVGLASV